MLAYYLTQRVNVSLFLKIKYKHESDALKVQVINDHLIKQLKWIYI